MLKVLTKVLKKRLEKTLHENQQAGFRSKYSTTDIHVVNQLKEKCREYNIPLYVAFVASEKPVDSVQTQAVQTSLQEQGIEDVYIELLKEIYTNSSMTVQLHKESNKSNTRRGVRHKECNMINTRRGVRTKECNKVNTRRGVRHKECNMINTRRGVRHKECNKINTRRGVRHKECNKIKQGEEYDRKMLYRPSRLRQHSKAYSDD